MEKSTITSKGQTTIPIEIREFLGVNAGDELQYIKTKSGRVEIAPRKRYSWRDLQDMLPKARKKVSDREIKASIEAFWTRKSPKPSKKNG